MITGARRWHAFPPRNVEFNQVRSTTGTPKCRSRSYDVRYCPVVRHPWTSAPLLVPRVEQCGKSVCGASVGRCRSPSSGCKCSKCQRNIVSSRGGSSSGLDTVTISSLYLILRQRRIGLKDRRYVEPEPGPIVSHPSFPPIFMPKSFIQPCTTVFTAHTS